MGDSERTVTKWLMRCSDGFVASCIVFSIPILTLQSCWALVSRERFSARFAKTDDDFKSEGRHAIKD